jgi:hypothetical protein
MDKIVGFRSRMAVILSAFCLLTSCTLFLLCTARSVSSGDIKLDILANGRVLLNGKAMPVDSLARSLPGLLQKSNRLLLLPQAEMKYDDWLKVYDQLVRLNVSELYVVNRKDNKIIAFKTVKDSTAYSPDPIANFTHFQIRNLQIDLRTHMVNQKVGFTRYSGEPVLPAIYSNAHDFAGPVTAVCMNHKWGLIDRRGRTVLEPHYFNIGRFNEGLASLILKTADEFRSGFLDTSGQIVIPAQFQSVGIFYQGHATAKSNGRWGIINKNGDWLLQPQYEMIGPYAGNRAAFRQNNRWGYIDGQGHVAIPPQYDEAELFFQNAARVRVGELHGFIDEQGRWLITPRSGETAGFFSEGLLAVKTDSLWGYMDRTGVFVIPPRYSFAQPFSEGLASTERWRESGYIDHNGEWQIAPHYVLAQSFYHGLAFVSVIEPGTDGSYGWYGFIDHAGNNMVLKKQIGFCWK